MSALHRTPEWKALTRRARPLLRAQLPLPCVNRCKRGGIVMPGEQFDVGHLPGHEGMIGLQHVGPAHPGCNRSDGGKVGAAIVNGRRRAENGLRPW